MAPLVLVELAHQLDGKHTNGQSFRSRGGGGQEDRKAGWLSVCF